MTRFIIVGLWMMVASIASAVITIPLGIGEASGAVFVVGLVYSSFAALQALPFWAAQRLGQKRNDRFPPQLAIEHRSF